MLKKYQRKRDVVLEKSVTAIILAAGIGSRMSSQTTKQKMDICGKSVLWHCVKAFSDCRDIKSIIVVCRESEISWAEKNVAEFNKVVKVVSGGETRAESAKLGFLAMNWDNDYVAIHDAARCLVTEKNISDVIKAAFISGAATAATAVVDTLKSAKSGLIDSTVSREGLYFAQTPQVFSRALYAEALRSADSLDHITDDNMLVEKIGTKITVVETGRENIKITTKSDLEFAKYVITGRIEMSEVRIGHGYDVHRLVEGRRLIIGGVEIPFEKGLLGHSDADVLTHAVMDALLGACGLGDIGRHFPDSSAEFKDITSLELLSRVKKILDKEGFLIINIDATVVMQKPRLAPVIEKIIENYAEILEISSSGINIKATTEEHLGFTGRMEGVSAHAVASVKKG